MVKYLFSNIFISFIFSFLLLFFSPSASAQSTSYKITDAFTMQGTGAYTGVMNLKYVYATKVSTPGRYVISNKPDGTGSIQIGNYLSVWVQHTYWHSMQSQWVGPADNTYSAHFKCPSQTTLEPQNVSSWFHSTGTYSLTFRFITSCYQSFPVSDMYLVFLPDPTPTPTATSTPTPTPTVAPFLDLPWDYRGQNLSFSYAATKMTSYFDHEYPTLSINELYDIPNSIITFNNANKDYESSYSSHDGYDFGWDAQSRLGVGQLAAASGIATYHTNSIIGNAIFIDHENRFQTRYYHLQPGGLVINRTNEEVRVKAGDQIGLIGSTGKSTGPHTHFMLVFDKNHDGDFDDNIPDGLMDPYGWEGEEGKDPWENATFQYPWGTERTGMQSRYLWKHKLMDEKKQIGPDGGDIAGEGVSISVPKLTIDQILEFHMKAVPRPIHATESANLDATSHIVEITATDRFGVLVRYFNSPFSLIIDLMSDVAKYYDPRTLSVYSSRDGGKTFQKEQTVIDLEKGQAIATVDHLTLFAVMGEKKDTTPPETTISASGLGKGTNYRSDVTIDIQALDKDPDTLGIEYTLYTLDSEYEWQEYLSPLTVASSGAHFVKAFSADKSGNVESAKRVDFTIDKKVPEISIRHATSSAGFVFRVLSRGLCKHLLSAWVLSLP